MCAQRGVDSEMEDVRGKKRERRKEKERERVKRDTERTKRRGVEVHGEQGGIEEKEEERRKECFNRSQSWRTQGSRSGTSSLHYRGIFSASFRAYNVLRFVARKRDSWRERRAGKGLANTMDALTRRRRRQRRRAAAAVAEVVDGGGVCRDKYLPVNTERLALPSRSIPMRAANDMHSRGRGTFDGRVVARHRYPVQQPHGASTVPFRLCLANIHSCSR
ncbi:hypothetical protein DBV15_06522, partial [Temnothorax longispinosus]